MDQADEIRGQPLGGQSPLAVGRRVFVSYTHDSCQHKANVRAFCDLLVAAGAQITFDQYESSSRQDWQEWMTVSIGKSDYVIVIASPGYRKVSEFAADPRERAGARDEYQLLRTYLAEDRGAWLRRILPVVLPGRDIREIPLQLQPMHADRYIVSALTEAGVADLLAVIGLGRSDPADPAPGGAGTGGAPAAVGTSQVRRLIAPSREALTSLRRLVIPVQRRTVLADRVLPAVRVALDNPSVVAVYADAGLGKSVLLGQVYDELARDPALGVILISASDKTRDRPRDVPELDRQLGDAALAGCPLTAVTAQQQAAGLRSVVLLDTLDLILDDYSLPLLGSLLRSLTELAIPVVLTCRDFEFREYLEAADSQLPVLGPVLQPLPLPRLAEAEIRTFALAFLQARPAGPAHDPERFIGQLLHLRARRRAVVEICGSPLLLRLVCELYGSAQVPEDLTVSRLYDRYWRQVVMGDPSRRVDQVQARQRNQVCLAAAQDLLARSTSSFVEDFGPDELVPPAEPGALDGLRSAGVLVATANPATVRFFHQTLAEYAIARHLARDPRARSDFTTALRRAGRGSHLWPVLVHLLFALPAAAEYLATVRSLDLTEQLAFRAAALSAVGRADSAMLGELAGLAAGLPADYQRHLIEAFGSAAEAGLEPAGDLLSSALAWLSSEVICAAAGVLGRLVGRLPGGRQAAVAAAMQAAVSRRRAMAADSRADEVTRTLLAGLAESTRPWSLLELGPVREHYPGLGPVGRAEAVRLHPSANPALPAALLAIALAFHAPPARAELASMFQLILSDPAAAGSLGWDDWPGMLTCSYPQGWDDAQIKATASWLSEAASQRPDELARLFGLVLADGGPLAERALHVAEEVTIRQPGWMTGFLRTLPPPATARSAGAVGAVLKRLPALDQDVAVGLLDWMEPAVPDQPLALLQAAAVLAWGHPPLLDRVLRDTVQLASLGERGLTRLSGKDLDRIVNSVLRNCPANCLPALAAGLRAAACHQLAGLDLTARVAGTLAPVSASDRDRCADIALGPVGAHARSAARRTVAVARDLGWFDHAYAARLIAATTPGVVEAMAQWIGDQQRDPGWQLSAELLDAVLTALSRTVAAPVAHQLLSVTEADVRAGGPATGQLHGLLDVLLSRTGPFGPGATPEAADIRRTLCNGILNLLQHLVGRTDDRAAAEAMLTRALTELPLDDIEGAEDKIRQLVRWAARVPSSMILAELSGRLPELPGRVQLGVAMAVESVLTSRSASFRRLSSQTSDPRVVAYVARQLAG